ncbi:MAG: hypothetical protein LBB39_00780 [Mycoplasmataceae bacterium]|jgi:hypothetical protein|nr:hypothetical protein [Mycoplasmataceae bacterium]
MNLNKKIIKFIAIPLVSVSIITTIATLVSCSKPITKTIKDETLSEIKSLKNNHFFDWGEAYTYQVFTEKIHDDGIIYSIIQHFPHWRIQLAKMVF